jgi:hypothetical protein
LFVLLRRKDLHQGRQRREQRRSRNSVLVPLPKLAAQARSALPRDPRQHLIPTALKNDRRYKSLFGAPPPPSRAQSPANPARNTNRRKRWKSQRFPRLVLSVNNQIRHADRRGERLNLAGHALGGGAGPSHRPSDIRPYPCRRNSVPPDAHRRCAPGQRTRRSSIRPRASPPPASPCPASTGLAA